MTEDKCSHPKIVTRKEIRERKIGLKTISKEIFVTECVWCKQKLSETSRFTITRIKSIQNYDTFDHWHPNDFTTWAVRFDELRKRRNDAMDRESQELIEKLKASIAMLKQK